VREVDTVGERIADLLRDGQAAARAGKRAEARRRFRAALGLDPLNVSALLWLAWLSDEPRASLAYVARALAVNPDSPHAHAALRWARQRVSSPVSQETASVPTAAMPVSRRRWWRPVAAAAAVLMIVSLGLGLLWWSWGGLPVLAALAPTPSPSPLSGAVLAPTGTLMPSAPPTFTPNATHTRTPTPTPTRTSSPTPTPSPTDPPTSTPRSVLPTPPPLPPTATLAPSSVNSNVHWIDVDLTHQRLTAYEGQTMVRTTLVSTGLPRTPTPVGRYHIQIKLRYDSMSGPGYYLPNVPYTMYFYRGYGLHGTYWHSNFGHPMSHGCINLPTPEAEWLFNWADVGTMVNVHY